jgi:biopolymer transport protein ExbD
MLLTRQKRVAPMPQLNMTPMIDVVFQLLIFFMCTSASHIIESNMPAQMPPPGVRNPNQSEFLPVHIRITRAADGVLIFCDNQACDSFDMLVGKLKARRAIQEVPVIIEGEPAVPFGNMVAALDACYLADMTQVAFKPEGVPK